MTKFLRELRKNRVLEEKKSKVALLATLCFGELGAKKSKMGKLVFLRHFLPEFQNFEGLSQSGGGHFIKFFLCFAIFSRKKIFYN